MMEETKEQKFNWQKEVDSYTEYLVDEAEQTISDVRMREMRNVLRTNQLSNLLSVAMGTDSVAAIVNWIRYQMGRRDMQRAWSNTGLGNDILERIKKMQGEAKKAADKIYESKPTKEQIQQIHVAMVRQYIGYIRRWFVAKGGQG